MRFGFSFILLALFSMNLMAQPNGPKDHSEYKKLLKLQKTAHQNNIEHFNETGYFPLEVIWVKDSGPKMVPRSNPFKKVNMPSHPQAGLDGSVYVPNIELEEEKKQLNRVKKLIQNIKDIENS